MVISWKLFWATLGAVISFAIAGLSAVFGVPLLAIILATVAAGVFVAVANIVVHGSRMFTGITHSARVTIVRWIAAAAAVHVVWVVAFELRPALWLVWIMVLVVLAALTYWVTRAHEYLLTQIKPVTPSRAVQRAQQHQHGLDQTERAFTKALEWAHFDWLSVLGWEPIGGDAERGESPFGVRFRVRTPSRRTLAESGATGGKDATKLTVEDAEPIAIALGEVLGTELESDWVSITKERAAGTYSVIVVTEDVMARVYPYEDRPEWTSITEPALVGYQLDGKPYHLPLKQHGQVVGQSTYGKSSFINVSFAHITRCADALLWVCGVEKLYDLVAGWIEPYMNTDWPLPIDWIANGQHDTLDMLVAGMTIARWRQKQPMSRRGNWPTIIIVLDEASFALENRLVRAIYQGMERTAADLAAVHARGAASGDVHLVLASQRSTNDNFGDQGGTVTANMGYSVAFKSKDQAEVGRLMGNYKLPTPRHKGEYWLDAGNGDLPIHLKAPYIQSVDPTKPRLHHGLTVADVAWSRRLFQRELDAGSARAAGEVYERRHRRMDPELLRYLTEAVSLDPELRGSAQAGYALAMRELDTELGNGPSAAGQNQPAETGRPASGSGVATLVGHRSRAERIVEIVRTAPGPISKSDIVVALRESGDAVPSDQVVTNALAKAVSEGTLVRPERGLYAPR